MANLPRDCTRVLPARTWSLFHRLLLPTLLAAVVAPAAASAPGPDRAHGHAAAGAGAKASGAAPAPKPHIVMLLTDNMGWANVGFHRPPDVPAREIHTPNIDALAGSGLILDRHY